MKATIDIWLENSLTIKDEHNDIFRNYVGFDLNIQGHDTIKNQGNTSIEIFDRRLS